VIEYAIFLQELGMEAATETKFGTKVSLMDEDDFRTANTHKYMHSAEKARDTTLNDKNYDVRYSDGAL